jgi:DNA-binding Lrp family transcriptional regulator
MEENSNVDPKDIRIIEILSANARSPLRDIAKVVGLSPSSVRNRMQRLVDLGVIRKYTVDVDHRRTGLNVEVIALLTVTPGSADDVQTRLNELQEITHIARTAGAVSFVCTIRVGCLNDLAGLITQSLERIHGVERIQTLLVLPKGQSK